MWTTTFAHAFSPGTGTTSSHRGPHVTHGKIQACDAVKMDPVTWADPPIRASPVSHPTRTVPPVPPRQDSTMGHESVRP